jgi:hypothetical protein
MAGKAQLSGLRAFAGAMSAHWFTAMSGPLTVPATIAALWIESPTAKLLLGLTAFVCFWASAYWMWNAEHEKVVALEQSKKDNPKSERDIGLSEALGYVCFREWGKFLIHAAGSREISCGKEYDEFLQAIADGRIPVWGKKEVFGVHQPIPNDYWFTNRVDFMSLLNNRADAKSEPTMASFGGDSYSSLMTSRSAVEAHWPDVGATGPRVLSALQISFGMEAPYKTANTRNLHQFVRTLSFKLSNRGQKTLSSCRVTIESVDINTGVVFPLVLAKEITLAPGDHVFIPLVRYGERMNPKISDCGDTFTTLATADDKPFFDVGETALMKLKATGIDTPPYDTQCSIWVNEDGRLQIEKERQ